MITYYEQIYIGVCLLSIPASEELVSRRYIVVIGLFEFGDDLLFIKFEVIAEGVQRRVLVSQLHIKKTCEHIGI